MDGFDANYAGKVHLENPLRRMLSSPTVKQIRIER